MADNITYDSKTKTVKVVDGFTGIVDGSSSAEVEAAAKIIDASDDSATVTLKAGQKVATLKGGKGDNTFISNSSKETFLGNTGSDTFIYVADKTADVIGNASDKKTLYASGDKIILIGSELDASKVSLVDKNNVVTITFDGDTKSKLTVNKDSANTPLKYYVGTDSLTALDNGEIVFGLSDDVSIDNKGTTIALKSGVNTADVETATMSATAKTIKGGSATGTVNITGNDLANVIVAGNGGGSLYGGHSTKAVNDKLIGGDGEDTFVYASGDGKDVIEGYDGSKDKIVLKGFTETIGSNLEDGYNKNYNFKDTGNAVVLTLNDDSTKGSLTINKPTGVVNVYDENGTELLSYGVDWDDGWELNSGKTKLTIGSKATANSAAGTYVFFGDYSESLNAYEPVSLSAIGTDLEGYSDYAPKLKEVDASKATVAVYIEGREDSSNVLRAGSAGSYLSGGYEKDQFYGGKSSDTFVYKFDNTLGGGKDVINDFGDGDKIIFDQNIFSASDGRLYTLDSNGKQQYITVTESGNNVVFTIDKKNSLTVKRTSSSVVVRVVDANGEPVMRYPVLQPIGTVYNSKKLLSTTKDFTGELKTDPNGPNLTVSNVVATLDAADFGDGAKTIDAQIVSSTLEGVYIIGNETAANKIYAPTVTGGSGDDTYHVASTLEGGTGNDKFYATDNSYIVFDATGGGNDAVYDFDQNTDYILVKNATVKGSNGTDAPTIAGAKFTEKSKDLIITVGQNSMTIKDYKFGNGVKLVDASDGSVVDYGNELEGTYSENGYGLKFESSKRNSLVADIEDPSPTKFASYSIGIGNLKTTTVDLSQLSKTNCYMSYASIVGNDLGNTIKVPNIGGVNANTIESGYGNDQIYFSSYSGGDTVKLADSDYTLDASKTVLYYVGGKDVIYNYDPSKDQILIGSSSIDAVSDELLTANSFSEKGNDIIVTFDKNNTLTLKDAVKYLDKEGITIGAFEYSNSLPSGLKYNSSKTAIEVSNTKTYNAAYADDNTLSFDLSNTDNFVSTVKKIDLSGTTPYVELTGNELANELYAGNGGSKLYGGEFTGSGSAPADKLFGGKGADVFIWDAGDGNDVIGDGKNSVYGAGDEDTIQINSASFWVTDSGNQLIVNCVGSSDKLTVNKAKGDSAVSFSSANGLEFVHGAKPEGSSFDNVKNKTKLTVNTTAAQSSSVSIEADHVASTLKEIDASKATAELYIVGNGNNNTIRGGKTASTLNGGVAHNANGTYSKQTNDTLFGGDGSDTFVYILNNTDYNTIGEGSDVLYDVGAEDQISLGSASTYDQDNVKFTESGNKVTLKYTDTETNKSATLTIYKKSEDVVLDFIDFKYGEEADDTTGGSDDTTAGGSTDQFAAPDNEYWFEPDPTVGQAINDPLQSILSIENNQIDLPTDFGVDQLKAATNIIAQSSARHRQSK